MSTLEKNVTTLYGEKGKQWLDDLPELVINMASTYELSDLKPVQNLSYNYVMSGFQNSQPIILKLSPDIDGLKREAIAIKAFTGFGVVKLIAESDGVLLLERAVSGSSLKSYFPDKENDAIQVTCECLQQLHKAPLPEASVFPHIKDWLSALDKNWDIPDHYLHKARQLRDNLLSTSAVPVLLHGDLHHDNILQNGDDWIIIDPKGVIGEPIYEVAAFIRNPIPELLQIENPMNIISNRISCFSSTLELPRQRIIDWCFVQAVLAWIWALEEGCDGSHFKQIAQIFTGK